MPAYKMNAGMQHGSTFTMIPVLNPTAINPAYRPCNYDILVIFLIVMQDNGRSRWDTPGEIPRKWHQTDISGKPWLMLDMLSASKQG